MWVERNERQFLKRSASHSTQLHSGFSRYALQTAEKNLVVFPPDKNSNCDFFFVVRAATEYSQTYCYLLVELL